ncbi:MAG: hypothetical protein AB8B85_16855, partial [Paracoccaceae bacterium]
MSEADAEVQDTPEVDAKPADDQGAAPDTKTLGDGGADDKPVAAPADWPEDWRTKLAGDDEKLQKRLDRMSSPADVLKSWRALEQKQSTGEMKATLPENATDEQVAEYREANGIPAEPKGYLDKLPDGLVIGENDEEIVNGFLDKAHGMNADPEFVGQAIDWFYGEQERRIADLDKTDGESKRDAEETLRA